MTALRCMLEKVGRTCSNNHLLRTKLGFFGAAVISNNYPHPPRSPLASPLDISQLFSDSGESFDLERNFDVGRLFAGGIHPYHGSMDHPVIIEAARIGVEQHNKQQNTNLEFVRVVKFNAQVLCGTVYYMTLEAIDNGVKNTYQAQMLSNASNRGLWELQLFRLAPPDNQTNLIDKQG